MTDVWVATNRTGPEFIHEPTNAYELIHFDEIRRISIRSSMGMQFIIPAKGDTQDVAIVAVQLKTRSAT